MIIRDKMDRFIATNLNSKKLLEKVVENDSKVNIIFESGIDHTAHTAYTVAGDVASFWNTLVGSGDSCNSRI